MDRTQSQGRPPATRRVAPWADTCSRCWPTRRRLADARAARRHHRLACHRRRAGDQGIRPVVPLDQRLGPGPEQVRRPGDDLRHAGDLADRDADRRAGELRHRAVPDRAVARMAEAPAGHRDRTARGDPVDRLRHVGPAGVQPAAVELRAAAPAVAVQRRAVSGRAVLGAAGRHRHAVGRHHPRDHDHPVHRLGDARRVRGHAAAAEGVGLWPGLDDLGSGVQGRAAVHQDRRRRRRHARPRPRARRDDGRDLRDRQPEPAQLGLAVRSRQQHHLGARQRVRRGRRGPAPGLADLPRPGAVLHHLRRAGVLEAAARAAEEGRRAT